MSLRLFSGREEAGFKRRRLVFLGLYLLVFVGMTIPVLPLVWNGSGLLGLPRAFLWVVFNLLVMFLALLWLYLTDDHGDGADASNPGEGG